MKLYDIIMGFGVATTIGGYIGNRFLEMEEKLELTNDLVKWTFSTFPEFFIGAAGTRIIDYGMKKLFKIKNYFVRTGISAAAVLGPGIGHELAAHGTVNSDDDLIKYSVGIGLSAIVNGYDHIKEKKDKNLYE